MSERLYLIDILKRIEMIERFTAEGEDAFLMSELIQEGVIRCFEVIGEAVKPLDSERLTAFPAVPWRQVAGFRDVLIHHYNEISIERVWQTVAVGLPPLREAIEALLASTPPDLSE